MFSTTSNKKNKQAQLLFFTMVLTTIITTSFTATTPYACTNSSSYLDAANATTLQSQICSKVTANKYYRIKGGAAVRCVSSTVSVTASYPSSLTEALCVATVVPTTPVPFKVSNPALICPAGSSIVTVEVATAYKSTICSSLGSWDIARIGTGTATLRGPSYGCNITDPDPSTGVGDVLCSYNTVTNVSVVSTDETLCGGTCQSLYTFQEVSTDYSGNNTFCPTITSGTTLRLSGGGSITKSGSTCTILDNDSSVLTKGLCGAVPRTPCSAGQFLNSTTCSCVGMNFCGFVLNVCHLACSSNCAACSGSASTCTSCNSATPFLVNGSCYATCPSGYYNSSAGTCSACSSLCASCSGSVSTCTSCKSATPFLVNGSCYAICPSGYYNSSANTCTACSNSCATCSGSASKCTSCKSAAPFLVNGSCYAACANGYYASSANTCTACSSPCATCSEAASTCTSCGNSAPFLYNQNCLTACPLGKYPSSSSTCSDCPSSCESCTDLNTCQTCRSGFTLQNIQCIQRIEQSSSSSLPVGVILGIVFGSIGVITGFFFALKLIYKKNLCFKTKKNPKPKQTPQTYLAKDETAKMNYNTTSIRSSAREEMTNL